MIKLNDKVNVSKNLELGYLGTVVGIYDSEVYKYKVEFNIEGFRRVIDFKEGELVVMRNTCESGINVGDAVELLRKIEKLSMMTPSGEVGVVKEKDVNIHGEEIFLVEHDGREGFFERGEINKLYLVKAIQNIDEYQKLSQRTLNKENIDEYQKLSQRTLNKDLSKVETLNNMIYGLIGESGEVVDAFKKHLFQGHELDINNVKEELGDIMFYIVNLCSQLDLNMSDVLQGNLYKLGKRYPEGFETERSVHRDV